MRSTHSITLILIAISACIGGFTTVMAQDEVIRVDTKLVTVPLSVLDRDGRYISNLKQSDFKIFENDAEQKVEFFEAIDAPVTVMLLLDGSGSMIPNLERVASACGLLVGKLRPDDTLMVAMFDDNLRMIVKPTLVKNLKRGINLQSNGYAAGTQMFDALGDSFKKLDKIKGRKALVLFTDGFSQGNRKEATEMLHDVEEQEATIYSVQFDPRINALPQSGYQNVPQRAIDNVFGYMSLLSERTGGRAFKMETMADLDRAFGEVAAELTRQYTLGYYPDRPGADGERRRLRIQVNMPNVAIRGRREVVYQTTKRK